MNAQQIIGSLRILLPVILTYLVGWGWLSADAIGPLVSAVMDVVTAGVTLGSVVWTIYDWHKTQQIARVASMSGVEKVVAVPSISEGTLADNPKVTSQ